MEGSEVIGCKLARLQGGQVVRVQSGLICKVAMLQNDIILTLQGTKLYTGQGGEVVVWEMELQSDKIARLQSNEVAKFQRRGCHVRSLHNGEVARWKERTIGRWRV
jgi:hypothetical protein